MKHHILFLSIVLFNLTLWAQDLKTSFISETLLEADTFFGVDTFDNTYYSKDNILYKKSPLKTFHFNSLALGDISSVSITNPLEIVVFYKDFNTVIILDNTLNIIQKISFFDKTIGFVAKADKNKLWLYNTDEQQLELYNYNTKTVIAKSQPQSLSNPKELKGNANFAWVKTTSNTIKVFNSYGSEVKTFNHTVNKFVVSEANTIVFEENNILYLLDTIPRKININSKVPIENIEVANNKIYLFGANTIFMFTLLKN